MGETSLGGNIDSASTTLRILSTDSGLLGMTSDTPLTPESIIDNIWQWALPQCSEEERENRKYFVDGASIVIPGAETIAAAFVTYNPDDIFQDDSGNTNLVEYHKMRYTKDLPSDNKEFLDESSELQEDQNSYINEEDEYRYV